MRILFLTRKYPPSIGGMQTFFYNLVENFKKINSETYLIAYGGGKAGLPIFLIKSFFQSIFLIKKNQITYLHLGDTVLSPIGRIIRYFTGIKLSSTAMGLDVTYANRLYRLFVLPSLKYINKVFAISQTTKKECIKAGVSKEKITVITPGIEAARFKMKQDRQKLRKLLEKYIGFSITGRTVLLTNGRLVKRKGVAWFLDNIMPKLNKKYIYIVSGDGPEKEIIQKIIVKNNLNEKVFLLGRTSFETLKLLYNSSDIFIMPNIKVKDDMEGFGIVALEAASCGLPVIASDIEGIKDAVIEGKTGFLVKEKDSKEFVRKIRTVKLSRKKIIETARNKFSWPKIAKQYQKVLS